MSCGKVALEGRSLPEMRHGGIDPPGSVQRQRQMKMALRAASIELGRLAEQLCCCGMPAGLKGDEAEQVQGIEKSRVECQRLAT